jgi:hypothetical protein
MPAPDHETSPHVRHAWDDGFHAFNDGADEHECPYPEGDRARHWHEGFMHARGQHIALVQATAARYGR